MRRLSEYQPILAHFMRLMAKETALHSRPGLSEIFAQNPKLIVAMNHSTPLSWLPAAALLALHACAREGGNRRPMGVMDNFFFHVPVFRELAQFLTQTERPLSYAELSRQFEEQGDIDLVLFPEGSNCFFGDPSEIQEFRSPKFVDLAIRTGSPILIAVHRGSEHWAQSLPVAENSLELLKLLPRFAFDFLDKRVRSTGHFVMPIFPLPMEKFEMVCELYHPSLKRDDLPDDLEKRFELIRHEAKQIRNRMIELLEELKQGSSSPIG